jgi:hypothetical protein
MSNDENTNKEAESIKSEIEEVVEKVEEKAEEVVEKVEEVVSEAAESAEKTAGNAVASILSLKDKNPKVFYGGIAGVVLLVLIAMMMGGGSDKPAITGPSLTNIEVGKSYILKSPNSYSQTSTVRLASVPGSMAAYDDTEKDDREGCLHLPQGTPVTVKDLTDAFGKKNAFAKVVAESGECKGKGGWTSAINIQPK